MQEITVTANEAGQRLDRLLFKYLNGSPDGFIYKMLRKKNIVLNGARAIGNERLSPGDRVRLFLSDETIDRFSKKISYPSPGRLKILYEDEHVLAVDKPAGMLSQKAGSEDYSLTEYIIAYLLDTKSITPDELRTFRPSVCNRLDRNTGGIVMAGKTLAGLTSVCRLFKEHSLKKYYLCLVKGKVDEKSHIKGYLTKDKRNNTVYISGREGKDSLRIETAYKPVCSNGLATLLEVRLFTGRSHQIRAHLSSAGHPVIGDYKYGDRVANEYFRKKYLLKSQFLHSCRLEFPHLTGVLKGLSGKEISSPLPDYFLNILKEEGFEA